MYKFQPILKSTIWGGEKIVPYKQIASGQTQVGESWELSGVKGNESVVAGGPEAGTTLPGLIARHGAALLGKANFERFGEEFPLLIKFIDARQDLSIQVHPDDRLAWERHKSKGKTEMWYVVDADKGARLRSGFAKQVTPAQYEASVEDNTITDILAEYEIHPGDLFFLPAGRVHSIGAGAFIAEIQQTSDITYRIYDFNRKDADGNTRELHTELAKGAIDYTVLPDYRTKYEQVQDRETELVSCPYFTTSLNDFGDAIRSYANTGDEDDRDLSRVGLSLEMFRAYTEGYLSQRAKQLTDSEIDHLAFSARYITFEQVLRFLMDYIDGDTYYKVKYPGHNLVRTHAQYRLLQSMEEHYGEMCRIVRETVDKYRKA